jgi:integrase
MGNKGRRTHGDGALFKRKDGYWVARIELGWDAEGNRLRWQGVSKTQAGAIQKMREARTSILMTGTVPTRSMTLAVWLERWLEEIVKPTVRPMTYQGYLQTANKHIEPNLGSITLDRLTPSHVRALHRKVEDASSLGNANMVHRVLRACLSAAEREGIVPRNVAKLVQTKSSKVTRKALTTAQARLLIAKSGADPLHSRWTAALLTGARQGEVLGLQWDRVDLEAGTMDISWQIQAMPYKHGCKGGNDKPTCGRKAAGHCPNKALDIPSGYEYEHITGAKCLVRPKSSAGLRKIPMPPMLVDALRKRRRESIATPNPYGFVWTDSAGNPIDPRDDLDAWKAALAKYDLPVLPIHSARHTTATLLMELGVDVTIIQAIMGHSQATTTQGYQHADLSMARKALDDLGSSLAQ